MFFRCTTKNLKEKHKTPHICAIVWSVFAIDSRVKKYVGALSERGFKVDVIALSKEWRPKNQRIHSSNNVTVYEIDSRKKEKNKFDYIKAFIRFFTLSAWHVVKLQIKNKYALVHVHTPPDFQVFTAWLPKLMGAKIVLDIHDPLPDFFIAKFGLKNNKSIIKLLHLIEWISIKYADHVITVTDYWKKTIAERTNTSEKKMSVVVNLPDLEIFNARKCPVVNKNEDFILLYPGTINKHCGIDIALEAVSLIKDKIPDFQFKIYGKGTEDENIKRKADELMLNGIVTFHDHVPLEKVPELMANADAGIALLAGNDIYSKQALNVKLFEFLSMGLPSIATRTEATQYYLNDEVVMFSNPNDPDDVARCILELYHNTGLRKKLKVNGIEYTEQWNWGVKKDEFINTIKKMI